jgi:glucose-6-phosphate 1-dehydrogenase
LVSRTIPVDPFDLVIFGATGDLAHRKILPALYRRLATGQVPEDARIICAARSDLDDDGYRKTAGEALRRFVTASEIDEALLAQFLSMISYVAVDAMVDAGWSELRARLGDAHDRVRVFYLSVGPSLFGPIAARLTDTGIADAASRIVVEKPFGHDRESAAALNAQLLRCFEENRIYRIDHYLGKETVQNLMAIRFANALFEPLWNSRHVDHVQITVAESIGVEGRGGYYDKSGAMRDMVQNHLMQLLCLTAMEPPARFEPDAVRDEKLKVIRALEPIEPAQVKQLTVRGQYRGGKDLSSYHEDCGDPSSTTETFVALIAHVSNWRWSGTPFYLRTGKRLRARMSEISLHFKDAPHSIFGAKGEGLHSNVLVIRLQPDEGITLRINIKEPGPGGMRLVEVPLDMTFADALGATGQTIPDAYERLIMDVVRGDQTLFMRGDEVEAAWRWADPIIEAWEQQGLKPQHYDSGGSGPEDALMLLHRDHRRWREIAG